MLKPEIRIFGEEGQPLSLSDLKEYSGRFGYEIVWGYMPNPESVSLHEEGRRLGGLGTYGEALRLFNQAASLDPKWPYPVYDAAYTFLLVGDTDQALRLYHKVDALAPQGFFTAKAAIDCLQREKDGILPPGSYLRVIRLEAQTNREKKREVLESVIDETPGFPVAWNMLASLLPDSESKMAALEAGLSHNPDQSTMGSLLINKGLLLLKMGEAEKGRKILLEVVADQETTIENLALAQLSLATWE